MILLKQRINPNAIKSMKLAHFNVYFFFMLLLAVGVMMFFILQPFLTAILAAAILAVLFGDRYEFFLRKTKSKALSSFATILWVAALVIVPVTIIFSVAINEANIAYDQVVADGSSELTSISFLYEKIRSLPYMDLFLQDQSLNSQNIINNLRGLSQTMLGFIQALYQSVAHFIFWLFVMFFTLFYFLIDGKKMVKYFMDILPLRDEHEALLIQKFVSMSRATLRGTLLVGIIQGFFGGVTFAIAGVPSPVIWGLIMMIFSVIPMVGTGLVWFPTGVILLLLGQVWQGILILAVGVGIISTLDNLLRPKLVGRDTQMHPLMVFFATLGGLSFFGFPGFIIGPIIASLALALLEIYTIEFRSQLDGYNK